MFVAAGAWWLVSEANQRNDSRGTSLLSYPAVLNSYPFPVIHPRAKEGLIELLIFAVSSLSYPRQA